MAHLDWIGKRAVLNHHREIPFRLLRCDPKLSVGDPDAGNLLVQGDNLHALKALLPHYANRVKCVYIDPPYNTGNEGWSYNDNSNAPEIKAWLGKVVGKEAEDLSRHDKWLCMMYPRLSLLREFLTDDGAIFISIDDNEVHTLRMLCDEIFGRHNFVATVIWQKVYSPKNSARHFSEDHDYVLVYAKDAIKWKPNLLPRSEAQDKAYKNLDNDPRGPWKTSDLSARNFYSKGTYSIQAPAGRLIEAPPKGSYWRVSEENFWEMHRDKRIWWGKDNQSIPQIKRFLSEVKQGVVPQTLWTYQEVGHSQEAKKELVAICDFEDSDAVFVTPKPVRLMRRIIQIATDKDSIVLDSFAGSGSTGHAVLEQNRSDSGTRRFIVIEMEETTAEKVTRHRLSKVAQDGEGFRFCRLADPLFDAYGSIRPEVKFADLAAHIYFTETGSPMSRKRENSPLLGVHNGLGIYLLFNGILGDKRPEAGNILTPDVLDALPAHKGTRVIYGEGTTFSPSRLRSEGIVFKQVPYQVRTR
jgi:adenine-specific DNA-methyltransferase